MSDSVIPRVSCEVKRERAPWVTTTTLCRSRKTTSQKPQKALRASATLSVTPFWRLRVATIDPPGVARLAMAYPTLRSSTFRSAPLGSSGDQGPLLFDLSLCGSPASHWPDAAEKNLQSVVKPTPPCAAATPPASPPPPPASPPPCSESPSRPSAAAAPPPPPASPPSPPSPRRPAAAPAPAAAGSPAARSDPANCNRARSATAEPDRSRAAHPPPSPPPPPPDPDPTARWSTPAP